MSNKTNELNVSDVPKVSDVWNVSEVLKVSKVLYEGVEYDTMGICVDRHSGWIVAVPCLQKV